MTNQADSEWFLRNKVGDQGPLSEAAMRQHVEQSSDNELLIRQGNSDWHSVEVIRAKIRQLNESGISVRYKNVAEGPFTLTRAHDCLKRISPEGIDVQTGAGGDWIPAAKWLRKIDKLLKTESHEVDSLSAAVQQVLNRKGISGVAIATDELDLAPADRTVDAAPQPAAESYPQPLWTTPGKPKKPEPVIKAEPIYEAEIIRRVEPVMEVVKVMRTANASGQTPAVPKFNRFQTKSGSPNASSNVAASKNAELGDATIVRPQPTVRTRPTNRSSRKNKTLSNRQKLSIGALSVITISCVTVAGLTWFVEPANKPSIAKSAARNPTGSDNDPEQQTLAMGLPIAPDVLVDQATSVPSPEADEELAEPEATISQSSPALNSTPLTISTGTLFRPRFGTSEGEARAGTAFAAKLKGKPETLIISVLHLFGPAGGLKTNIQADKLATAWKKLVLEDCKSQNHFGEIHMQPLTLAAARPHPENSELGDIAICKVMDATEIEALQLSQRVPANGERVWLVSKVIGSGSLIHAATVESLQNGWLLYSFDDRSINLQDSNGAPVIDRTGSVVAVNASITQEGSRKIGSGTPVCNFYRALAAQL